MVKAGSGASEKKGGQPSTSAFVFFRPQGKNVKELLSYNEEAWRILCASYGAAEDITEADISSLCSKWRELLDRKIDKPGHEEGEKDFIEVIQSGRRRYSVKGFVLSNEPLTGENQKQYIFILDRTSLESMNLSMHFRRLRLNNREQQIVRLLLTGSSNKEIADALCLSLNTVKGYMKLLMSKLGVGNRAGIVAAILAAK